MPGGSTAKTWREPRSSESVSPSLSPSLISLGLTLALSFTSHLKEKEEEAAQLNWKRKGDQERNQAKLQQLAEEWESLVGKSLQIEVRYETERQVERREEELRKETHD